MKEQISLKKAKQNYKRNIIKYGESLSFKDSILKYYLSKKEITDLYEYAIKITSFSSYAEEKMLNNKYQEYLENCN